MCIYTVKNNQSHITQGHVITSLEQFFRSRSHKFTFIEQVEVTWLGWSETIIKTQQREIEFIEKIYEKNNNKSMMGVLCHVLVFLYAQQYSRLTRIQWRASQGFPELVDVKFCIFLCLSLLLLLDLIILVELL